MQILNVQHQFPLPPKMGENSSFSTETQSFKKELMHFNPEIPLAGTCPAGQSAQNSITEIYPVIEAEGSRNRRVEGY